MLNTIRSQDTGDLVKVAQYLIGYADINKASGNFDSAFHKFLVNWQKNKKIYADGIIGPETWELLAKNALTCSTAKNKKSAYTCAVQILIGGLTVDGIYGARTKKGVTAFQSAQKLSADGICGPKTWYALIVGQQTQKSKPTETTEGQVVSGGKILNNCVKYLQWDKRWKSVKYSTHTSSQTIGNSGCGTTSMAMIMATWIDPSITPVEMSALAVQKGYRSYDSGTKWGFFKYIFNNYDGFSKYIETSSVATLQAALREGALAVCSMNSHDNSYWTKSGYVKWPISREPRNLGCRISG